jgi:hypothetical protein
MDGKTLEVCNSVTEPDDGERHGLTVTATDDQRLGLSCRCDRLLHAEPIELPEVVERGSVDL